MIIYLFGGSADGMSLEIPNDEPPKEWKVIIPPQYVEKFGDYPENYNLKSLEIETYVMEQWISKENDKFYYFYLLKDSPHSVMDLILMKYFPKKPVIL